MKDQSIINAWNKIEPDAAADARMLQSILARNRSLIEVEVKEGRDSAHKKSHRKWLVPLAVCLALVLAVVVPLLNWGGDDFDLQLSQGVKVKYISQPPAAVSMASLVRVMTEDELFAPEHLGLEIAAFEGAVKEVRNIVCDYNGFKDYRALATIEVSEVLRGDLRANSTVTVLLPAPVGTDRWIEDTDISARIAVGTRGIFMPARYDQTSVREENGMMLNLSDLAGYGLLDGMHWLFIETEAGLVYFRDAYPSFGRAKDLQEVKEIIYSKIGG